VPRNDASLSTQGRAALAQCRGSPHSVGFGHTMMGSNTQSPRLCQPRAVGVIHLLTLASCGGIRAFNALVEQSGQAGCCQSRGSLELKDRYGESERGGVNGSR
jgi:hypothetical protein